MYRKNVDIAQPQEYDLSPVMLIHIDQILRIRIRIRSMRIHITGLRSYSWLKKEVHLILLKLTSNLQQKIN